METSETHGHLFSNDEWPFFGPTNTAVFTTTRVIRDSYPILLVFHDHDGDWQFLCGTTNETSDCLIVCFGCTYQRDKSLGLLADLPVGWQAWRGSVDEPWKRIPYEAESEAG